MNRRELMLGSVAGLVIHGVHGRALAADAPRRHTQSDSSVPGDRWLEIDLYWFQLENVAGSAKEFWDRYLPLYAGVAGLRGAILNVGWTVACVMDWAGDLGQKIDLPCGSGQQKWVDESGPLTGTTGERKKEWKQRFAQPVEVKRRGYDAWTYGSLKHHVSALREEGARRGIPEFKVGILNYAWKDAYGEVPAWPRSLGLRSSIRGSQWNGRPITPPPTTTSRSGSMSRPGGHQVACAHPVGYAHGMAPSGAFRSFHPPDAVAPGPTAHCVRRGFDRKSAAGRNLWQPMRRNRPCVRSDRGSHLPRRR